MLLRNGEKPPMEAHSRDLLCSLYEADLRELEGMLERPLLQSCGSWGHGRDASNGSGTRPGSRSDRDPRMLRGQEDA
jgi:hypothetical protein